MNRKHNTLIIRMSALGDVAMTIPVIYSVAQAYPNNILTVLTQPFFTKIFINQPSNVRMISFDFHNGKTGWKNMISLLRQLESYDFDDIADLHNILRSWIIDLFFCIKRKKVVMVDKMRRKRHSLTCSHKMIKHTSMVERYMDVFSKLGMAADITFTSFFDNRNAPIPFIPNTRSVGIAPFARYYNKTYPIEQMEQVVKKLSENGIETYLFGGGNREAEILQSWQEKYRHCKSVANIYDIQIELALMNAIGLIVSMDSANQHLASLVGAKVITIWGATTPVCGFNAYGQTEAYSVCLNLDCQPCSIAGGKRCRRNDLACLKAIEPDMIVEMIEKQMKGY